MDELAAAFAEFGWVPDRILVQGVAPDGFQLADERESLLWGFVNMLDSQTQRLDRAADKLMPELRDLQRAQDGTEIKSRELELVTDRAQNLTARRDAFEIMRDAAAEAYRDETGGMWRPRRGSHVSQTGKLTSAAIDARDYQRARKDRKTMAHLPQGTQTPLHLDEFSLTIYSPSSALNIRGALATRYSRKTTSHSSTRTVPAHIPELRNFRVVVDRSAHRRGRSNQIADALDSPSLASPSDS